MDVTFFEDNPYYSKTDIQGENFEEYQFLDYPTLYHSDPIVIPVQVDSNSENPGIQTPPTDGTSNQDAQKDYIVYTRRPRQHTKVVEQVTTETHNHESPPNSPGNTQSNDSTSYISPNESDDLNILVALRKGKRSCTMHSISNFVSYDKLSPKYKSFCSFSF